MGKTIRLELWHQLLPGQAELDRAQQRAATLSAQKLLEQAVPNYAQLIERKEALVVEGSGEDGSTPHPIQSTQTNQDVSFPHISVSLHLPPASSSSPAPDPTPEPATLSPPSAAQPHPEKVSTQHPQPTQSLAPTPLQAIRSSSGVFDSGADTPRKRVRVMDRGKEQRPGETSVEDESQTSPELIGRLEGKSLDKGRREEKGEVAVEMEVAKVGAGASEGVGGVGARVATVGLSLGAIERCIPYPYRHTDHLLPSSSSRAKQRVNAPIHFSYLDPPPPQAQPRTPTNSSNISDMIRFSKVAPSLAPGRRGAWIIPISDALPWKMGNPAPPVWLTPAQHRAKAAFLAVPSNQLLPSSSPAAPADGASRSGTRTPRSSSRRIEWTSARLRCTWFWLTRLHTTGKYGSVSAAALTAEQVKGTGMPDHIRVYADAHLALSIRHMLKMFDVASAQMQGEEEEELDRGDRTRFLEKVGLVWVDESGVPVLVA